MYMYIYLYTVNIKNLNLANGLLMDPSTPISLSSSYISHGVGPLVDQFRSHVSRSLFKGLP